MQGTPPAAGSPGRRRPALREQVDLTADAVDLRQRDELTARLLIRALDERFVAASLSRVQRVLKRGVDVAGAFTLLVLALPVLLVTALAVKRDSAGPVLFRQERVGLDGRVFRIVKFRSMVVDNDDSAHAAYVSALIAGEAESADGVFKLVADNRVTRVGRFIRRYSIDELPQLWNVLRGDMSLVGPRPALPREVALYDQFARQRLAVKPGLTGLWQVSGRCELTFAQMVELDLIYTKHWSLLTDLRILLKTPVVALSGRGAA
jgi:exopolysaccharide biosynthesis polyprenyl glycosylphosphotransferase